MTGRPPTTSTVTWRRPAVAAGDPLELAHVRSRLILERDVDEIADSPATLGPAVRADVEDELRNVEGLDDRTAELGVRAPVCEEAVESGETTCLGEGEALAAPRVMQEPGEPPMIADRPERSLRVSPGQVHQLRPHRRHGFDEAMDQPGDDGSLDVPTQHGEHGKLKERALRNDRDVVLGGGGGERAPALDAQVHELLPRLVSAGRDGRNEWVR